MTPHPPIKYVVIVQNSPQSREIPFLVEACRYPVIDDLIAHRVIGPDSVGPRGKCIDASHCSVRVFSAAPSWVSEHGLHDQYASPTTPVEERDRYCIPLYDITDSASRTARPVPVQESAGEGGRQNRD
jgi:hypothetical protein